MSELKLTCIVCPVGCSLAVEETHNADGLSAFTIAGNRCSRGAVYAQEEIRAPKRVVTATCAITGGASNGGGVAGSAGRSGRLSVKTSAPCPKEKIPELLADIYRLKTVPPVKTGDILISGWKGFRIDVVASRSI